jgi:hypothetical protein
MNITTIEITNTSLSYNLDGSKSFAIFLTSVLSGLQLCHWYADDYNVHQIVGDLYNDLRKSFDKLQEEIIGITKCGSSGFVIPTPDINVSDLMLYKGSHETKAEEIVKIINNVLDILNCQDLKTFIDSSSNGINNTREEILSSCNKSKYLLTMIK